MQSGPRSNRAASAPLCESNITRPRAVQVAGEGVGDGTPTRSTGCSGPMLARPSRWPIGVLAAVAVITGATDAAGELDVPGCAWGPQELTMVSVDTVRLAIPMTMLLMETICSPIPDTSVRRGARWG